MHNMAVGDKSLGLILFMQLVTYIKNWVVDSCALDARHSETYNLELKVGLCRDTKDIRPNKEKFTLNGV